MAEGLEFLLELDAKLDGALGMVRELRKTDDFLKKVDGGLKKVEHGTGIFDRLSAAAGHLAHKVKEVGEFEAIRRGWDKVIELPGEMIHKVFEVGEEMISVAAKAERTNKSFELLFGVKEGKETLEWLEGIAKFTEFTDDELKGMAQSLAKVGFEGKALPRALAASLDMAAFSGSGQAGAESALSSLEMIKMSGRVENRQLKGLGIGKDDFLKELSARTGEGTAILKSKLDEGRIAAETSLETLYSMIAKKTGKKLGGAGVEMSNTLEARLKHLKDLPDQFFQKLAGAEGFAKISEFTGKLVDALDPDSATGKKIMGGLANAFDTIGAVIGDVDIESLATKISTGMTDIAANVRPAVAVVGQLWDGLKAVTSGYLKMVDVFHDYTPWGFVADKIGDRAAEKAGLNKSILGDRMGGFDAAAARAELKRRGGALPAFIGPPAPIVDKMEIAGFSSGTGYVNGILKAVAPTRQATSDLGLEGIDALSKKIEAHSPSKVFERLGTYVGEGFNQGIEKSMAQTDSVMRGAFAIPSRVPAIAGRPQISITVGDIHVNAPGADGRQIAEQVSTHIRSILPGELQSAFEQVGGQVGSDA